MYYSVLCLSPTPHLIPFFFTATAPTEIYTLSLHDALPICFNRWLTGRVGLVISPTHDLLDQHLDRGFFRRAIQQDRKSTRLNSSHMSISYAVFCLKKKNENTFTHVLVDAYITHDALMKP